MPIPADALTQYRERGYAVLPDMIDASTLARLREECAYFLGYVDSELDARGKQTYGITHRGKRYFIANRYRQSAYMPTFLYGELMGTVAQAFLGHDVYLFNEQWVVKGAEQGMKFAWHQDSGYVNFRDPGNQHAPYLTCWCALDDMTRANGTISVLPHHVLGTQNQVLDHELEPGSNDLVGYRGDEPGDLVEVKAGSIAVFSSTTLHRSSANTTDLSRRAYLAQYSAAPLTATNGSPWGHAVPFVRDGQCIYDADNDTVEAWGPNGSLR